MVKYAIVGKKLWREYFPVAYHASDYEIIIAESKKANRLAEPFVELPDYPFPKGTSDLMQ
jgi:hypothetical protein